MQVSLTCGLYHKMLGFSPKNEAKKQERILKGISFKLWYKTKHTHGSAETKLRELFW